MMFSLKSKGLKKILAIMLSTTMVLGLLQTVPGGTLFVNAASLYTSTIDVWDFGGTPLPETDSDTNKYNNNITYDFINSCYPGVKAGTTGQVLKTFTSPDGAFKFFTNNTSDRWRLTAPTGTPITCYDVKSKTDAAGHTYSGFLYSNSAGKAVLTKPEQIAATDHVEFILNAGDILNCWLGSNGNAATYAFVDSTGKQLSTFNFDNSPNGCVEDATFYAPNDGTYSIYCTNEKLVLARATREHTPAVTVSGTVTAPASLTGCSIEFTNTSNGAVTDAAVTGGAYSASLNGKYTYNVALKNANGYVISTEKSVTVGSDAKSFNVSIIAVDLVSVSGTVSGLPADQLANLKLSLSSNKIYVPDITLDKTTGAFSFKAERGVTYTLTANNVNDYSLNSSTVEYDAAASGAAISFTKKPTYKANVSFTGLGSLDTKTAKVTFTNINESGYTYTYGINDGMQLRNGQYSVKVTGLGQYSYQQGVTPDVIIKDKSGSTVVPFTYNDNWTFANLAGSNSIETAGGTKYFAGLAFGGTGSAAINGGNYLLLGSGGTVTVPNVKAGDTVTVSYCYAASFTMGDVSVDEMSLSTSVVSSKSYTAKADGNFVITSTAGTTNTKGSTYFVGISVAAAADQSAYKSTVYVGADKQYKTINDALAAIRKMTRTDSQNVTIMIDPGNYEEMLVIDTPNVTLKNASSTPSTALKNKGVDIDSNAVRVTWYYGHGYTYYSMGSDSKYNAALLAANKLNGYASYVNTGAGTTNGSYWNATVSIEANNVSADGIIFENSYNQYVSAASVNDVIQSQNDPIKNVTVQRENMKTVGDTSVQDKAYVERAAALAIYNSVQKASFSNCKFVGRQDTLYGGTSATAAFNNCSIYGGTDYIFGAMTAVFNKCNLVFNTSDNMNDVGYITAPQQASGRGFLMYKCIVTSTTPGVDTASTYKSKPGFFGRPWAANTGEAVFYKTIVEAADPYWNTVANPLGKSLIQGAGWLSTLSGQSPLCAEYKTNELSGVDNSNNRVTWATKLPDGNDIAFSTFLGTTWTPCTDDVNKVTISTPSGTTLSTSADDLKKFALTADEQAALADGEEVTIQLLVQDADSSVSEADKALVNNALDGNTIGQYLTITLQKKVGDKSAFLDVTEIGGKIALTITLPDSLKNADSSKTRTYKVIRIHNGQSTVLDCTYDATKGTLTFYTDKFSTFALAYTDALTNTDKGNGGSTPASNIIPNPATGDIMNNDLLLLLLTLSLAAVGVMFRKKGKNQQKK